MTPAITLSAGKANDGRVAVSVGATSVLLTEESASWLHRELGRALDIETLSTQLQQELVVARLKIAVLEKSRSCVRGALTRAKRRRGRR